jgi:hypothetical protein
MFIKEEEEEEEEEDEEDEEEETKKAKHLLQRGTSFALSNGFADHLSGSVFDACGATSTFTL